MRFHWGLFGGGLPQSHFLTPQKGVWDGIFWALKRCVNGGVIYTPFLDAFYGPCGTFMSTCEGGYFDVG